MSGKRRKARPRAYGRLTTHERDTVRRMLERRIFTGGRGVFGWCN